MNIYEFFVSFLKKEYVFFLFKYYFVIFYYNFELLCIYRMKKRG